MFLSCYVVSLSRLVIHSLVYYLAKIGTVYSSKYVENGYLILSRVDYVKLGMLQPLDDPPVTKNNINESANPQQQQRSSCCCKKIDTISESSSYSVYGGVGVYGVFTYSGNRCRCTTAYFSHIRTYWNKW